VGGVPDVLARAGAVPFAVGHDLLKGRGDLLPVRGVCKEEVACLRATVGLCRLWRKQGRVDEARQMLAEVYGWFTEGFDMPDLQEAKALLEELSRN
jgi:hypothetical protein